MGRLQGKVILVTGAGRGMGRCHAIRLAEEGADLILVDICAPMTGLSYPMSSPEDLAATAKEVEALGRRVYAAPADIRNRAQLEYVVDAGVADSAASTARSPTPASSPAEPGTP